MADEILTQVTVKTTDGSRRKFTVNVPTFQPQETLNCCRCAKPAGGFAGIDAKPTCPTCFQEWNDLVETLRQEYLTHLKRAEQSFFAKQAPITALPTFDENTEEPTIEIQEKETDTIINSGSEEEIVQ